MGREDVAITAEPSNPDTIGTQYLLLDYRGVLFSVVIDTICVWLNSILNDVMWSVTLAHGSY